MVITYDNIMYNYIIMPPLPAGKVLTCKKRSILLPLMFNTDTQEYYFVTTYPLRRVDINPKEYPVSTLSINGDHTVAYNLCICNKDSKGVCDEYLYIKNTCEPTL